MTDTRARKLCKGWLDYKQLNAAGSTWERAWVVLRGNTLFIFEDDNTIDPNRHKGTLTVDRNTKFIREKDGSQQKGYKFDLTTGRRHNRFKTKKASERELWRGYILGVANGVVPDDIDLLESEIDIIRTEIRLLKMDTDRPRNSIVSNDSGMEDMLSIGAFSKKSTGTGSSGSGRSVGSITPSESSSGGGPMLVHRFYPNSRDQKPPSWFFVNCSRDRAEQVIKQGRDYGNTLMRESTTDMRSGSYVITKGIWDRNRGCAFEHFKVTHTAGGYKIDVENKHEPMRYLSEVMEYFVRTSGGSSMPMSTNDLSQLGIDHTDYDRVIQHRGPEDGQPWVWPPPVCRDNVAHDYDTVADPAPVRQAPSRQRQPSQTLRHNPGGRSDNSYYPNKTVGAQGFGGPKGRPTLNPVDIEVGAQASARLSDFDRMLGGFDPPSYVNVDKPDQSAPPPPPPPPPAPSAPPAPPVPQAPPAPQAPPFVKPSMSSPQKTASASMTPPAPHTRISQHSYVNDADDHAVIASLPVAPPPPRHPIGPGSSISSASSTPSLKSALKSPSSSSPVSQTGRLSSDSSTNSSPGLRKVQSAGQFGGVKSTGSPASFPSWTKDAAKSDTKPIVTNNEDASASSNGDDKPATFSSIRNMFDGKSKANAKTDSPAGGAALRKQGVKRVTIQDPPSDTPLKPTASQLNTRRNTAPELNTQSGSSQSESGTMQGLNPDFKKQLEGLFAGSKSQNQNANRPLPVPADHEYEELPDRHIMPDSVTYVNDVQTSQNQNL